jgi:hypothetical protein
MTSKIGRFAQSLQKKYMMDRASKMLFNRHKKLDREQKLDRTIVFSFQTRFFLPETSILGL